MGSRAVVIGVKMLPLSASGLQSSRLLPVCATRARGETFNDAAVESAFIDRVQQAVTAAGLWEKLDTDWICLDAELMPWSAKAQALIKDQYAAVGQQPHSRSKRLCPYYGIHRPA